MLKTLEINKAHRIGSTDDAFKHSDSSSAERNNACSSEIASYLHRPLAFLYRYIRHQPIAHGVLLLSMIAAVSCSLASQYAIKHLIDVLGKLHNQSNLLNLNWLWGAFLMLTGLISADNLLWRVVGWMGAHAFSKVAGDLKRDLFQYLSGHAPAYFIEKQPGVLASRITATSNAIYTTESMMAWHVLPTCVAIVGAVLLVITVSPLMAVVLLSISVVLAAVLFKLAAKGKSHHRAFAVQAASVDGELVDIIGNMSVVRAFGAIFREQECFGKKVESEMLTRRNSLLHLEKLRLLHAIAITVLSAGLVGWALYLWVKGRGTSGDIVLISSLGLTILHGTRDLAVALIDITQHIARLDEALETLLKPYEITDQLQATPLVKRGGCVDFEKVCFAYPHRTRSLNHFDLHIAPGERVGLVGESGAGKSTVLALLQRFYEISSGCIKIDDQSICMVTQQSLSDAIAVVPQDISLFHRTIFENIAYGRPNASQQEIFLAAHRARCTEFIDAMPDGFETLVGDRGVKLSGGQRQRIAIARAILKDAPILLLDEATSALDSVSESEIQKALDQLMRGRTVIAIAHRLSTLQNFDRIIVMGQGRVLDAGSPAELCSRAGPYRELLWQQQFGQRSFSGWEHRRAA